MTRNGMLRHGPCPFVNAGDGRCSCRMTKQTLGQAFDFCLGGRHFACQTYQALSWERQADADDSQTQLQPGAPAHDPDAPLRDPAQPAAAARRAALTVAGQAVA
ncbi:MAG: hypothetical protein ACE37H_10410 [Phycisphaeraceae bacterium]